MNISLQEDKICKDIEKLIGRINTLKKKKKLWGLTSEEDLKMIELILEYLKNYYQLIDIIFNNYIEPFIYNDKIVNIKTELFMKYEWDGNLTMFEEDIERLMSISKDSRVELVGLIEELKEEEILMAKEFSETEYGKEACEMFCILQNIKLSNNCIEKYIITRYDIILGLIEMEDEGLWED